MSSPVSIQMQRTQAAANRNGRSKQPIIEAANQALAFLVFFVYATQLRCVRLNGNRASDLVFTVLWS